MTDLERRFAVFEGPVLEDGQAILTGRAPASSLDGYQTEVTVYTSGLGQLVCTLDGYGPCHNEEEVIEAAGYDPDADLANPSGSVFCTHEREKQARSREMNALAEEIRREVLAAHVGTEDEVLLETPLSETLFTGYTRLYIPVVVSAPGHKSGEIVHVRLGEYDGERVRAALC